MQLLPLDLQLNHFKSQTRLVVDRALMDGKHADIFKPTQVMSDNLIGVGIEGRQPAVAFNVIIPPDTQTLMNKALLLLSNEKLVQLIEGEHKFKFKAYPINFRGKTAWDTRLDTYQASLVCNAFDIQNDSSPPVCSESSRRLMFVTQCPLCHKQSSAHNYKFQYTNLDCKIKCVECNKHSAIKYWKCNCGSHWHACKVHLCATKDKPDKAKPRSSSKNEEGVQSNLKRLHKNANFDQLLDDDLRIQTKRVKKLSMLEAGGQGAAPSSKSIQLRSSMLSPSLRHRFAHLLSLPG